MSSVWCICRRGVFLEVPSVTECALSVESSCWVFCDIRGQRGRVPHKNHLGIFILFLDLLHVYFHLAESDFEFLPLFAEIKLRDVTTS